MKSLFRNALFAAAGAIVAASSASAAISMEAGSLAIAFYQTDASGSVVQPNTYVFDLGQASLYRESSGTGVSVSTINGAISGNIGTDLAATFGAGWANSGTVRWMIVGGVAATDSLTNGDPARTSYISRANNSGTSSGPGSTIPAISTTNRGFLSTNIDSFFAGVDGAAQTVGANLNGAIIATSAVNSVEDFLPPATAGLYFGQGIDPRQAFGAGTIGGLEGSLDLYRVLHSTTGADLTAGASTDPAVIGQGQYAGNFGIDGLGNLTFTGAGAIPEPSSVLLLGAFGSLFCLTHRKRIARKTA